MRNMVDIGELLDMISPNRGQAIEKYIEIMEEDFIDEETMRDMYEESPIIGTEKFKRYIEDMEGQYEPMDLDQILKEACPKELEFHLIKEGSRKRYLTKYKRKYIELSRKEGYSYREIGNHIGITGASARNMLKQ